MRINRRLNDTEAHGGLLVDWKLASLHCASRTVICYTVDRAKPTDSRESCLQEAHAYSAFMRRNIHFHLFALLSNHCLLKVESILPCHLSLTRRTLTHNHQYTHIIRFGVFWCANTICFAIFNGDTMRYVLCSCSYYSNCGRFHANLSYMSILNAWVLEIERMWVVARYHVYDVQWWDSINKFVSPSMMVQQTNRLQKHSGEHTLKKFFFDVRWIIIIWSDEEVNKFHISIHLE